MALKNTYKGEDTGIVLEGAYYRVQHLMLDRSKNGKYYINGFMFIFLNADNADKSAISKERFSLEYDLAGENIIKQVYYFVKANHPNLKMSKDV